MSEAVDTPGVACPRCGLVSDNKFDVEERYCAACHRTHDLLPEHAASVFYLDWGRTHVPIDMGDTFLDAVRGWRSQGLYEVVVPNLPYAADQPVEAQLEFIWGKCNHVDRESVWVAGQRSMSVGDLIGLRGGTYVARGIGFALVWGVGV
jgi:hypothetical protein